MLAGFDDLEDLQDVAAAHLLELLVDLALLEDVGHVAFGLHDPADGDVALQLVVVELVDLPKRKGRTFAKLPYPMS